MAQVDKYVDSDANSGRLASAPGGIGAAGLLSANNFEVAAADSDNSVYRIMKGISPTAIPQELAILADSLTTGTAYVAAITYDQDELTTGSVPVLVDLSGDMDLSSGAAVGSAIDGLASIDIDQIGKTIAELIVAEGVAVEDWSNPEAWKPIDLVLKATTSSTAAGTIAYKGKIICGD